MDTMLKKSVLVGAIGALAGLGAIASIVLADSGDTPASVGSPVSMSVNENGLALVRGAEVLSVGSSTISAKVTWGSTSVTWVVRIDASTEFARKGGSNGSISEIMVGDIVSFQGMVDPAASQLTVKARTVRDWSNKVRAFNGTVASIASSTTSFMLNANNGTTVNVMVTSATKITRGGSPTTFGTIAVGERANVEGLWSANTNSLNATRIEIKNPLGNRTIFEGRLKSLAASTTPTTMVVTLGSGDYAVHISAATAVLNFKYLAASLSSFKVGDHIRIFGAAMGLAIDATIVRDVNLK